MSPRVRKARRPKGSQRSNEMSRIVASLARVRQNAITHEKRNSMDRMRILTSGFAAGAGEEEAGKAFPKPSNRRFVFGGITRDKLPLQRRVSSAWQACVRAFFVNDSLNRFRKKRRDIERLSSGARGGGTGKPAADKLVRKRGDFPR